MIQQSPRTFFYYKQYSIITTKINDANIQQKQLITSTTTNIINIKNRCKIRIMLIIIIFIRIII